MDGYSVGYINSLTNKMLRAQCRANGIVIWYYDESRKQFSMTSAQMREILLSLRGRMAPQGEYGPIGKKTKLPAQDFQQGTPRNVFTALLMPLPPVQHPMGRVFRNE
jgi:hypothetical protein